MIPQQPLMRYLQALAPRDLDFLYAAVIQEKELSYVASPAKTDRTPVVVIPPLGHPSHQSLDPRSRPSQWDRPNKKEELILMAPHQHHADYMAYQVAIPKLLCYAQRQLLKQNLKTQQSRQLTQNRM